MNGFQCVTVSRPYSSFWYTNVYSGTLTGLLLCPGGQGIDLTDLGLQKTLSVKKPLNLSIISITYAEHEEFRRYRPRHRVSVS